MDSENKFYTILKNRDIDGSNKWLKYCKKKNIYYIVVYKKRKYSEIIMDNLSLSNELYDPVFNTLKERQMEFINIVQNYVFENYGSHNKLLTSITTINNVPNEIVEGLAEKIVLYINKIIKDNSKL